MVKLAADLFSKNSKKPETIMVIGSNIVFDYLFKEQQHKGVDFSVIVVDTCPMF
jgi:translation initiation factor 2B subunit (eIF-2B alpha/beta/delta family)